MLKRTMAHPVELRGHDRPSIVVNPASDNSLELAGDGAKNSG
jgi:hypothetical protein